jgi:hypothetical protein
VTVLSALERLTVAGQQRSTAQKGEDMVAFFFSALNGCDVM